MKEAAPSALKVCSPDTDLQPQEEAYSKFKMQLSSVRIANSYRRGNSSNRQTLNLWKWAAEASYGMEVNSIT